MAVLDFPSGERPAGRLPNMWVDLEVPALRCGWGPGQPIVDVAGRGVVQGHDGQGSGHLIRHEPNFLSTVCLEDRMNMNTFPFKGQHLRVFCERMKLSSHMQGEGPPGVSPGDSGFPFSFLSAQCKDGNDKDISQTIRGLKYLTIKVIFSVLHRQQEDEYGKATAPFSEGTSWPSHLV